MMNNDELMAAQQLEPEIAKSPLAIWLFIIAVGSMALVVVLTVIGAILLAWNGKAMPGEAWTFAALLGGGLTVLVGGSAKAGA